MPGPTAYMESGPFVDTKSQILAPFRRWIDKYEGPNYPRGMHNLLEMFIEWSLAADDALKPDQFVLAHPDLDWQNIFVDENGFLQGIIDWSWVAAVPRTVGCQKYPLFLTRDYDPTSYDFDFLERRVYEDCVENTPEKLSSFRCMYSKLMELSACTLSMTGTGKKDNISIEDDVRKAANMTRESLVQGALELAAKSQGLTSSIISRIVDEIERNTAPAWDSKSIRESRKFNHRTTKCGHIIPDLDNNGENGQVQLGCGDLGLDSNMKGHAGEKSGKGLFPKS